MIGSSAVLIACLFSGAGPVADAVTVPTDKCIEAHVVRTLTAPADPRLHMPTDVAVDSSGRIYVADGAHDRIVRFSGDGMFDLAVTEPGGEALSRPVGITLDAHDRLWIADTGHHRLLVVGRDGTLAERIELPEADGDRPFDPTDVAVTADGKRTYIVDNDNHRIVIRANDSGTFTELGPPGVGFVQSGSGPAQSGGGATRFGAGLGQFRWPFMIGIGPEGCVYVSEAIGARVQRISAADRWAGQVGRWGIEPGQFYRPKGVAVDAAGRLYVSDSTLGVVQVFGCRGHLQGMLTDVEGEPLRFEHPMSMCFDPAGRLYVVELKANRVAVVALSETSASASAQTADQPGHGRRPPPPDRARDCAVCHLQWVDAFQRPRAIPLIDEPGEPVVADARTCLGCHDGSVADSRRWVWRDEHGHQAGLLPPSTMKVPDPLPLPDGKLACRTCHTPHAEPGPETAIGINFTRVTSDAGQLCLMCHADYAHRPQQRTHPMGPTPQPVPDELIAAGAVAGPDRKHLSCRTCHTPHGPREASLLLTAGENRQLCLACHKSAQSIAASLHSEPIMRDYVTEAGIPAPASFCGPCHAVHVEPGVAVTGGRSGLRGSDKHLPDAQRCFACHGAGGHATQITPIEHPMPSVRNVHPPGTAGFMPLLSDQGALGDEGRIACLTCHLPHGRSSGQRWPAIDAAQMSRDELRRLWPMVRPYVAPNLCSSCHDFDGLRRHLYYHHPEKRRDLPGATPTP